MRYQVTRFGEGFAHHRKRRLTGALRVLNRRLRRLDGPFTIGPAPKTYLRRGCIAELRKRFLAATEPERFIVKGDSYDQPAYAIRSVDATPAEAPHVTWAKQFIAKSPYLLGATGPPGKSDCSALTMNAVKASYNISLVHSANLQSQDGRIRHFHDPEDLQSGDFVFLNYGRLDWPTVDHVEFWVKPGQTIGSRPSTGGVGTYNFTAYDASRVVTYGRLRS